MQLKNRFFSTYVKIMISQYEPLSQVIKANAQEVTDDQTILSSKQINEVLNGPYGQFMRLAIPAYAAFNKLIAGLNLVQDTLFKTKRVNIKKEVNLPSHLQNYPLTKITSLEKNLSKLINEGYQTWQKELQTFKIELLESIKQLKFPVSEIETREFQSNETITSVLKQFTEFKIAKPKVNFNMLSMSDYLLLKTYLVIHNSLARRQQPSANANVMIIVKKLSSALSKISKKEKQRLQLQKKEFDQLIQPIKM